ncbi:Calcium uniporter protein, mitochondrial [Geodia barretti]|uniref:Calcium uniporter protein n=1 Tax=Geodia barretti TaxID=519541 RepID=A0AA35SP26_GEOBA|nr:Calcium uniporter protein, mitochondrial [Geodia barretti]
MALRCMLGLSLGRRFPLSRAVRLYSSGQSIEVGVREGFPVLSLPLPSRNETCDFVLRPFLQTVAHVTSSIRNEDPGIERVVLYSPDGNRISSSTGVDLLLQSDFHLHVNDLKYHIKIPTDMVSGMLDGEKSLSDVRNVIHKLYTSLNVDRHQLSKERELRGQLEALASELAPLETQRQQLAQRSERRTNGVLWAGLGWMSLQFGFFARLTWWEYSWDIMEPVTYFVGYGTSILIFTYFVLTRQDYNYPEARDRQYLNFFSKMATRNKFDVEKYNHLKDTVAEVRSELDRLRDPLQLNLPTSGPTSPLTGDSSN